MIHRKRALLEAARLAAKGRVAEAYAVTSGTLRGRDMVDLRPGDDASAALGVAGKIEAVRQASPWTSFLDGFGGRPGGNDPLARLKARLPVGARIETPSFGSGGARREALLYVPSRPDAAPALVVMLHGCTQTSADFALGTRMNELAERHGFLVLYPEQTEGANASRCWNWFSPENQARDAGEPAAIVGLVRDVCARFAVDASRVFAAGLSAGGSEAAILGATYPDLFRAIGVHSGLPWRAAHDVVSAFSAMRQGSPDHPALPAAGDAGRPRIIVFHGDEDGTVHPANADQVFRQGFDDASARCETTVGPEGTGRSYTVKRCRDASGRSLAEQWTVNRSGHAWSGGSVDGTHTDPKGPDASGEMVRFFLDGV